MTKRIQIRLSDDDYRKSVKLAEGYSVTVAEYAYARTLGVSPVKRPVGLAAASKAMRRKVSKAGHKGKKEASRG